MRNNEVSTKHSRLDRLNWALMFSALLLFSAQASAQIFSIGGSTRTAVASDHTALAGRIAFTLSGSPTTGAGTIVAGYGGVPIANSTSTGMQVSDTFASHASIAWVDSQGSNIGISVPAGVNNGTISLDGVRLDIAAAGVRSVTATVSAAQGSGFLIAGGSTSVVVVDSVLPGLVVGPNSASVVMIQPGATQTTIGQFVIQEGFKDAFSNAIGTFGQTVPTQIQLLVTGLPAGVTVTFPNAVTASTGGASSLSATSALVLPTSTGVTSITYQYSSDFSWVARSFTIAYQVNIAKPLINTAVISIQATLFPPDATDIPRYNTVYVPSENDLPYPEFDSALPVLLLNNSFYGLAFTNPNNFGLPLSLTALDLTGNTVNGLNINNPASMTIAANQQTSGLLEDFFGSGIQNVNVGTILVKTTHAKVAALYMTGNNQNTNLDGGTIPSSTTNFILPFVSIGNSPTLTNLGVFNSSASAESTLTLTVLDNQGNSFASKSIVLEPQETLSGGLSQIVGKDLSSVSGGYIEGSATQSGVYATVLYGDSAEINLLNANEPFYTQTRWIPHFIAGGGYDTEIDLVNTETTRSASVQFNLFNDNGHALAGTTPTTVTIAPLGKKTITVSSLLGSNPSQFVTGSLRMDVQPIWLGPVPIDVNVTGGIRFYSNSPTGYSTVLPIDLAKQTSAVYPHVAQNLGYYTGVAVLNPQDVSVTVTVDVYDKNGNKVGTDSFPLAPQSRIAKLLYQMVPQSNGQQGGYFQVSATDDVYSFALFGDTSMRTLAAIPAQ